MSDNTPNNFSNDNYDWRISAKQKEMIYDTANKMSKKEASLYFKLGRAILDNRISELKKAEQSNLDNA